MTDALRLAVKTSIEGAEVAALWVTDCSDLEMKLSLAEQCATPLRDAWVRAPPSSSKLTSSPVTVFTTSGPVMNMCEVSSTIITKSVIAGE